MSQGPFHWLRRFWQGIRSFISPPPSPLALPPPRDTREDSVASLPPAQTLRTEESYFEALVARLGDGLGQDEVASNEYWKHFDALWDKGDEMLCIQWLEKFLAIGITAKDSEIQLQLRLIKACDDRGQLSRALEHLEALTLVDEQASQAHFQLAEYFRSIGEDLRAIREYESVLALDINFPKAKLRHARLRQKRGAGAPIAANATVAGPSAALSQGTRYQLTRELGRGAAGVVYFARDMQLEREVAIKLLHPHFATADKKRAVQSFFDEARLAASLRHPNIVAIFDLDEDARRIVMELCAGGTLRSLLSDRGPRPLVQALERHSQILSALEASHQRGVVHRDLKPDNLMFRRDPDLPGSEIVLADFGIAHLPASSEVEEGEEIGEGQRKAAVGTLAYMAPEQRRGEVSPGCDLYASAVVLFEMLTGGYPWSREILLAGERSVEDFELPDSLPCPEPSLRQMLQEHLNSLGHPDLEQRPNSTEAMKAARRLRDRALVCGQL